MARCGGGAVHFVLSVQREHDVYGASKSGIGLVPAAQVTDKYRGTRALPVAFLTSGTALYAAAHVQAKF